MTDAATLGGQLYAKLAELLAPPGATTGSAVVLLETCGKDIDPDDFRDAADPSSTVLAEQTFADLVNPVSVPGPTFVDTGRVVDAVYDLVVRNGLAGDLTDPTAVAAAGLLSSARADLELSVRATTNPGETFHPAQANPKRWFDPAAGWSTVSFSVGDGGAGAPQPGPGNPPRPPVSKPKLPFGGENTPPIVPRPPAESAAVAARAVADDGLTPARPARIAEPAPPPLAWRRLADNGPAAQLATALRPAGSLSLTRLRGQAAAAAAAQSRVPTAAGRPPTSAVGTASAARTASAPAAARVQAATDGGDLAAAAAVVRAQPGQLRYRELLHLARAVDAQTATTPTTPAAGGYSIRFEYTVVSIARRWLHPELFAQPGWTMPGFAAGAVSTGGRADNDGLLPAMTTRFLAVRNLEVRASWSGSDRTAAEQAQSPLGTVAFGPFALTGGVTFDGAVLRRPGPQIVAWLAATIPAFPRA